MGNNNSARQTHVSPGVYTKETDLTYASKSLGITTLGVAGETVKGPAFQPMMVENWREFQRLFGGTDASKFRGSQYPKYELPYIAQSYLKQSNQMYVCRVLGLSGVNAGPAWIVSAAANAIESKDYDKTVISVIRSRGEHEKAHKVKEADPEQGICEDVYQFDGIKYYAKDVMLIPSADLTYNDGCNGSFDSTTGDFTVDAMNYGRFTILVLVDDSEESKTKWENYKNDAKAMLGDSSTTEEQWAQFRDNVSKDEIVSVYSVSLNPGEKNYILNILGGDPENGDAEIYVEELYDVALKQLIEGGDIDAINHELVHFENRNIIPKYKAVNDILTEIEDTLTRKDIGKRFLYVGALSVDEEGNPIPVHQTTDNGVTYTECAGQEGGIYKVVAYTKDNGTREYYYVLSQDKGKQDEILEDYEQHLENEDNPGVFEEAVRSMSDNTYYVMAKDEDNKLKVTAITIDMNNYKEEYRYASTPWIVSELKGSANYVELKTLFRFHTISDGNMSNTEVKVSIENINPTYGTFDVVVRDFYDTDASPVVYERFRGVNLVPGDKNYIAMRIGSSDEKYVTVSSYITVEVNENDVTKTSIPAGFLGYPVRNYVGFGLYTSEFSEGGKLKNPYLRYNTNVDDDIRIGKQYFGLSDLTGIDEDVLKYKGFEAYNGIPTGYTPGFHLDSRIFSGKPDENGVVELDGIKQTVTVDGVAGYEWVTVGAGNVTAFGEEPRIGTDDVMMNTIYEDKRYRKFTLAFYGGWDGWDYYRTARSNGDEFKYLRYKGNINLESGEGDNFSVIREPELYNFDKDEKVINSDWYAYMSAIRAFANPRDYDINVFATPGIDYVNNNSLVGETITMIEEERADSIYVVTTPDKPFGASDSRADMYTPSDAVDNLEDSEIDSNYACTYYPWVKYFDPDNSVYLYLPPTRDVVKNMALTDNTRFPWFPAAGWNRGDLDTTAVSPKMSLKLKEQDELYAGRINFINKFAQDGMKIWGDNNLQVVESQLNKISKRRLLLHIRKLCAIAGIGLIFDPNDNTTKQSFESAVKPILDNVLSNRGIIDWRLEIDDSQEARDRLELPCKIYLKLTPNLEYITIDFIVTPSGVSFDDI